MGISGLCMNGIGAYQTAFYAPVMGQIQPVILLIQPFTLLILSVFFY